MAQVDTFDPKRKGNSKAKPQVAGSEYDSIDTIVPGDLATLPLPVRALYGFGAIQDAAAKIDHTRAPQQPVAEGVFEVSVTATVTTKVQDKTVFLIEAKQAGIFELRNLGEQTQAILGIACPGMVYPYLRAIVSDVCTRAGFPPVTLSEVNFQAMFEAQQQQLAAQGNGATSVN